MCVEFLWSRSRYNCILRYLGFESSQNIIPTVQIEGTGIVHSCGAVCLAAEIGSTDTTNAEEVRATSGTAIGS
jgi:hypothetical protein